MRLPYCLSIILYMLWSSSLAQTNTDHDSDILMYSYFKGNGEDGLHLAYSLDGYDWNALNNGRLRFL